MYTYFKKRLKYVGDIAYGLFTGTGIKLFNNGTKAEGEWWHDEITSGKFTYPDGTVINVERENQQIKYTLNGVDVSNIFLNDGDFNGTGKITWQNITDGGKVEYDAKWENNKSVVNETKYPSLLLIKDSNDVVKHKYQTTTILKRKDIKSTPPKRLCHIPCANKDILWITCCRLECAQDLNNLNSDDKKSN